MSLEILVVDDSALLRRVECDIINSDNKFKVTDTCKDGLEALEKLRTKKYDGVVLDINMPRMDGLELLQQLQKVSDALKIPKILPYFGVTRWEPGKKVEEAYSEANFAKNRIKDRKDVLYQVYSQADTDKILEEKRMEDDFYKDLKAKRFEIWYQPKYDPKTNELVGAEGLVRWRDSSGNIIPPGRFIPLFESNGLIKVLDEYVFRTICECQRKWQQEGKKIVPVSINLSRASLYFESVVKRYHDIAGRIGVKTELVPIEITESAAIDNDNIKGLADRFHSKGFPLLVDDFGSGYSSLATLNMKCFDTLKIDKSLIDYIGDFSGLRESIRKLNHKLSETLGEIKNAVSQVSAGLQPPSSRSYHQSGHTPVIYKHLF